MQTLAVAAPTPWLIELITVRNGSHSNGERHALSRDVERGLLLRVRKGVYIERTAFEAMSPEEQHIVLMRSVAATSDEPVVFSHWSAAVLFGLPVLRGRLQSVQTTVRAPGARGEQHVTGHVFALTDAEVVDVNGLQVTGVGRTVVDVAGGGTFEEGVMVADAALHAGAPRDVLEAAAALVGHRRSRRRIGETIAFAHPASESAQESRSRATMMRLGVEPPVLQHRMVLRDGSIVFLDFLLPSDQVGGEADGAKKLLDPVIAPDARRALVVEKAREDEVRSMLRGFARWGWVQSGNLLELGAVLVRAGVSRSRARATLADCCAAAREGRARFVPRRP